MRGMRNRKTPLTPVARELRKDSTDAERRLWSLLRNRTLIGCKFRRQFPIDPYVVDFACVEKRLIVELDGGQHVEDVERDERRTIFLRNKGYAVLRFWNDAVFSEPDAVVLTIVEALTRSELDGRFD